MTQTFEIFMHLYLLLASTGKCTLKDCLKFFLKELKLTIKYIIEITALRSKYLKGTEIWKLPPIMVTWK